MPPLFSIPDDMMLSARFISLPEGSNSPSPPTSGFPEFIEDPEVMDSRGPQHFAGARASEESEIDFSELYPDHPRERQDTEPYEPQFSVKEEDRDYEDDTENREPSKYDTKPPAREPTQTAAMVTPMRATSASVRRSPRNRRSATTSVGGISVNSTPHSSVRSHSRTTNRRRSLRHGTEKIPDFDEDAVAKHIDTHEEDAADDDAEQPLIERSLRKRTLRQTNPFKFDKHQHKAQKTGQEANTKKIEKAIKEEIGVIQKHAATKMAWVSRGSSANNKMKASTTRKQSVNRTRGRSSSVLSMTASPQPNHDHVFDPARATLRVRLNKFPSAAATPITLSNCEDNDKLMDFIVKTWEFSFNGARFSYAVASFPWLTDQSNILLRPGLEESFRSMVTKVKSAPIWAEDEHALCDFDVTVYVQ